MSIVEEARAIHKSDLSRQANRAWGTVGHHLRVLCKDGRVVTEMHGGRLWVFPGHLLTSERSEARALAENEAYDVLAAVEEIPEATVKDLEGVLKIPTKAIRRHLRQLSEVGLTNRTGKRAQTYRLVRRPSINAFSGLTNAQS